MISGQFRSIWKRKGEIALGLILVGFVGLFAFKLSGGVAPLSGGELKSTLIGSKPLLEIPQVVFHHYQQYNENIGPPFYYMLVSAFLYMGGQLGGPPELWVRLLSISAAVASLIVFYHLCRLWFSERHALVALALFVSSSPFVRYAYFAQPYSLMIFLSILSQYSLERQLRESVFKWKVFFVVTTSLNIYNHYFALGLLGAQIAYICLLSCDAKLSDSMQNRRHIVSSSFYQFGIIISLCLPLLIFVYHTPKIFPIKLQGDRIGERLIAIINMWSLLTLGEGLWKLTAWSTAIFGLILGKNIARGSPTLLMLSILLLLNSLLLIFVWKGLFISRYVLFVLPFFVICQSMFIRSVYHWLRRMGPVVAVLGSLICFRIIININVHDVFQFFFREVPGQNEGPSVTPPGVEYGFGRYSETEIIRRIWHQLREMQ